MLSTTGIVPVDATVKLVEERASRGCGGNLAAEGSDVEVLLGRDLAGELGANAAADETDRDAPGREQCSDFPDRHGSSHSFDALWVRG
jgi:hypothetical protein